MGKTQPDVGLSDAAGGRPAGRLVARPALNFCADRCGATAIEHALLAACLGLVIITAGGALTTKIYGVLEKISDAIGVAIG
jgi:Flp pilus assembly pilin Flp